MWNSHEQQQHAMQPLQCRVLGATRGSKSRAALRVTMPVEMQAGAGEHKQSGAWQRLKDTNNATLPLFSNQPATHSTVRLDMSPTSDGITPDSWLLCRFLPAQRRNKGDARWGDGGSRGANAS